MKKGFFKDYVFYLFLTLIVNFQVTQILGQNLQSDGFPNDFNDGKEIDPTFSNNGKNLAFILETQGRTQLYICKSIGENKWSDPESIDEINNFNGGNGNIRYPAFNYNGSVIYYCADFNKDSSDFDIFYSVFIGDKWSEPVNIGEPINSVSYDGQPSISANDQTLFFVRNKLDNPNNIPNCKTILLSRKSLEGEWSNPEILPMPINVECEQNPRIGLDNKTLYFSSNREGGKGGYDNYISKVITRNIWAPAENIGNLNSVNNDYTPTFFFDSDKPYYAVESNNKENNSSKIYNAVLSPGFLVAKNIMISGKIREFSTQQAIVSSINVYDPITSKLISTFSNNSETGDYQVFLSEGNNYLIDFTKQDYSHSFLNISALNLKKNEQIIQDINLYKEIKLNLNVFDAELFKSINAEIEIINSRKEKINPLIEQAIDGKYAIIMPIGDVFQFTIKAEFYEQLVFDFDLTGIVQFNEFEKDIELKVRKVDFHIEVSGLETQINNSIDLIIHNLENNEVVRNTEPLDSSGKFKFKLRDGDSYQIYANAKGYLFYNSKVELIKGEETKRLEIKLEQLLESSILVLNNITFESNSADLDPSSFLELQHVVNLMNDNPNISIEIGAHTDDSGSDTYNLKLSKKRANSVMDYLLEQKFPSTRIISQGYGKSKPFSSDNAEGNNTSNERVEVRIIKTQ